MDDNQDQAGARLLVEQLGRFQDKITARMDRIEESIRHHSELEQERISGLQRENQELRRRLEDQETRLRAATDGVTTFKTWSGLASGGSTVFSIIALVKSFFGL